MNFEHLFDFLERLQANNHKAWMDEHRKEYQSIRKSFVAWLNELNDALAAIDPQYTDTPSKKAMNRINNNLLYHPHLPTYKDHFAAGLDQLSKMGDFYIQIGVSGSFVASGYWNPPAPQLKSIREAIDYDGQELLKILKNKTFKDYFGELLERENQLKKAPQGYENDHPYIDLLKYRSYAVMQYFSRDTVCSAGFKDQLIDSYKVLLPFRRYLNRAVTV